MTGSLQGLSLRNIRGQYFAALEETQAASWIPQIAETYDTDQPFEIHKWVSQVPAMEKWAGERRRQQLKDFGLTVVNDKFESTIELDVDDVRRDKTGQLVKRVRELGAKAATLPQRLFTAALVANGNGYDGAGFFADTHNHGGACDNNVGSSASVPAAPTAAEMSTAILASITAMLAFTDDRGDPANEFARSFLIMVPVKYWSPAVAALNNAFVAASTSNTLLNMGLNLQLVFNPRLPSAANIFYTFRTDAPVKPLIWQEETIPDGFKTLADDGPDAFWRDLTAAGAKRIGQAALGQFLYASRTTLS